MFYFRGSYQCFESKHQLWYANCGQQQKSHFPEGPCLIPFINALGETWTQSSFPLRGWKFPGVTYKQRADTEKHKAGPIMGVRRLTLSAFKASALDALNDESHNDACTCVKLSLFISTSFASMTSFSNFKTTLKQNVYIYNNPTRRTAVVTIN